MVQLSTRMPTYDQMMNPLIKALRILGGSGSVNEIYEEVIKLLNLPDSIVDVPHGTKPGTQTEVAYRLAWTRTYLKKYGILENSARGIWSLAPTAKKIESVDSNEVVRKVREISNNQQETEVDLSPQELEVIDGGLENPVETQSWRDELINVLISMNPAAFERLTQRLLRES